ncbi:MAG: hypothetical protein DI606_16340 [Sphingobium sp.]|uniref:hypothetical protein n=1 Tax=Sphingobium sp. TaxID=1912891 RepID=UPI000DAFD986|nr:hypothetical protein [Sphingobium sp.]PZU07650.1 MAG: hypothetical protein DI606_16340 [Sphingobium sp.]
MKPKVDQPANPLFTNGENFQMNACVGANGGPYELFHYANGFFEAGHAAIEAARKCTAPVDTLIYPIAFSYRHAIELMLKQMIVKLNLLLGSHEGFKKSHQIDVLWDEVSRLTAEHGHDLIEPDAVERIGAIIGHFHSFDPTGQVFRYPFDRQDNRHLEGHSLINVEVLQVYMHDLQQTMERWYYEAVELRHWQLDEIAQYGVEG